MPKAAELGPKLLILQEYIFQRKKYPFTKLQAPILELFLLSKHLIVKNGDKNHSPLFMKKIHFIQNQFLVTTYLEYS